jgi:hypothetical protein
MTRREVNEAKIKRNLDNAINHGWNRLDLRNCGLTEFPSQILDRCPDLMFLDLGNDDYSESKNEIKIIPDEIIKLKKLKNN